MRAIKIALLAFAVWYSMCAAAAPVDGPYVMRNAQGNLESWTVESAGGTAAKHVQPVAVGAKFTVAGVGKVPAFPVTLRKPAQLAPDTIAIAATAPLFVVADTHGEFEILIDMLLAHRIVNARLGWGFGRGHLIVLGDVFDRGPNHLEILWLLYELEAQARRAGGGVHLLLGNHETMVMSGDLRYLNPKYAEVATLLGAQSYSQLFDARSVLGQWLRTRHAVVKINDSLFLHGGISPGLVGRKLTLAGINDGVRGALSERPPFGAGERAHIEFVMGTDGPLWYRGYFPVHDSAPTATLEDIDASLAQFGVQRIFVGHTIVPTITALYDGKVIAVQVYPAHDATGTDRFEALSIKRGKMLRALPDGTSQPLN